MLPYQNKIDALILGCTHYPILLKQFQDVMEDIDYISSSASICQEVASYLKNHHLENTSSLPMYDNEVHMLKVLDVILNMVGK